MKISLFKIYLLSVFLFSCGRYVDKAQLTFTLPGKLAASAEPDYVSGLVAQALATNNQTAMSTGVNNWSPITPTGFTGERELNCFFVIASAPDLNQFSCSRGLGFSTKVFSFGEIAGPAPAGASISMDILPGDARVFRLLGMHANTSYDCSNFGKLGMKYENLTRPYVVGISAPTKIFQSANVAMALSNINLAQAVDSCDWSELSARAPSADPVLGNLLESRLDTGIFGGNYILNKCLPVNIGFRESATLLPAINLIASPVSMALSTDLTTAIATYDSALNCTLGTGATSTFSVENSFATTRWVSGNSTVPHSLTLATLNYSSTQLPFSGVDLTAGAGANTSATTVVPAAQVNEFFYNGSCVPVSWVPRALDWSQAMDFNTLSSTTSIFLSLPSATSSVGFYALSNCTGGPPADLSGSTATSLTFAPSASSLSVRTVYIKLMGFAAGQTLSYTFSFSSPATGTHYSFYNARVLPDPQTVRNPVRLKITGPTNFLSSAASSQYCLGPFKVASVDDRGVEIYTPLATYNSDLSFLNTELKIYRSTEGNFPCDVSTEVAAGFNFVLGQASGRGSQLFYVRTKNTSVSVSTQYVYVNLANGQGIPILDRDSFALHFNVDGTTPASTASPAFCSGTNCIFRAF